MASGIRAALKDNVLNITLRSRRAYVRAHGLAAIPLLFASLACSDNPAALSTRGSLEVTVDGTSRWSASEPSP